MNEPQFFNYMLYIWFGLAGCVFLLLFFIKAPYGRYTRSGWGPLIGRRLGWVIMEAPSFLGLGLFFILGNRQTQLLPIIFLCLWEIHYFHRSFIFPFQMRGKGKQIALLTVVMGVIFNLGNTYINGRWLFYFGPEYTTEWLSDPRFIIGILMFITGFVICKHSDHILQNLRKPDETGYKIPQGGMYRLISCPNYFGEIFQWFGWAVATWSLAGLTFAVWTTANLFPRALTHHKWYKEEFSDYPAERKAIIPFIL
jgi:3-oxo-5-alpha-steroid 4-dehydrogenase 1